MDKIRRECRGMPGRTPAHHTTPRGVDAFANWALGSHWVKKPSTASRDVSTPRLSPLLFMGGRNKFAQNGPSRPHLAHTSFRAQRQRPTQFVEAKASSRARRH
jgi:hypothetical protein